MNLSKKNNKRKHGKYINKYTKKKLSTEIYQIKTPLDLDKSQFINYFKSIISVNSYTPIFGYITIEKLNKFYNKQTFLVYRNGLFLGMVYFRNMTFEFKKSILGSKYVNDASFISKSNINNYIMGSTFITSNMNKILIDTIINKFRKVNNLLNSNIIIILMTVFGLSLTEKQISSLDIFYRYKPIIEYTKDIEYKTITSYGFKYNGYHVIMHNELVHLYTMRFIKESLSSNDFFPTYIVSRQFKNLFSVDLTNIKLLLKNDGIITMNTFNRYCLDNTLLYYTGNYDNEITSIYYSLPYKFNFVMNYITNELGNSHIITNYYNLYWAVIDIFGKKSKYMKYFCEVVNSYDRALEVLSNKSSSIVLSVSPVIILGSEYSSYTFVNKQVFINFMNNNQFQNNGLYIKDFSFHKYLLPIKTNTIYNIEPYLLFTFINNKLQCYMCNIIALLIFSDKYEDIFVEGAYDFTEYTFLVPPLKFHDKFNDYASKPIDLDKMTLKMRDVCSIIGKVYKKYVNLQSNQIHGFRAIHPVFRFVVQEDGEILPLLYRIDSNPLISRSKNKEVSEWIYNLAIKPAIYKDLKLENSELEYQPLDID
jgi:hypothetical protein